MNKKTVSTMSLAMILTASSSFADPVVSKKATTLNKEEALKVLRVITPDTNQEEMEMLLEIESMNDLSDEQNKRLLGIIKEAANTMKSRYQDWY